MLRAMAGRRFLRMWTSRARWAGSRACFRYGSHPVRPRRRGGGGGGARRHAGPCHGLCEGLLRSLNAKTGSQLAGFPTPQIGFNYLGRFPTAWSADWVAAADRVTLGGGDPATPLTHCIEVNALTVDSADGPALEATWSWAGGLLCEEEARDLAQGWYQALEALVRHAERPGAGGRSPCDLPLLALSQAEIARLESKSPHIEDMLPLSALQAGL